MSTGTVGPDEMNDLLERVGVVPVIVVDGPSYARDLGNALASGGLPIAEITLRTPDAMDTIAALSEAHPDLAVGAGTVRTVQQAKDAKARGASFLVAPGFNEAVVDWSLAEGIPIYPGISGTEGVEMASARSLTILKFFPAAAAGGTAMLKALAGPYQEMRFMPTGGVSEDNLADYLNLPCVLACGGSWIASRTAILSQDWDGISSRAAKAVELVSRIRTAQAAE